MCVLAFAWQAHPRWPIVLIGNRDEYHARPSAALSRWEDNPGIIAGCDLQSGGTWLGVAEAGTLAVVTNHTGYGLPDPEKASRGALVTEMLTGAMRATDAFDVERYNSFNLIVADANACHFTSNRPTAIGRELTPGVYGLSNGTLDEPWARTTKITALLSDWLASDDDGISPLLDGLRSDDAETATAPDGEFPPADSRPMFIRDGIYGTRCSTIVLIDRDGAGSIHERRYAPHGKPTGETRIQFSWPR
jgi:uncharacterized protein with NRDE domain